MKEIKKSSITEEVGAYALLYTDSPVSSPLNNERKLNFSQSHRNFVLSPNELKELLSDFFGNSLKFDFLKEAHLYTQSTETEFARKLGKFELYELDSIEKELVAHKRFSSPTNQTVEVSLLRWLDLTKTYEVCIYLNLDKAEKQFKLMVTYKKARSSSTREYVFPPQPLSLLTDGSQIFHRFSLYSNQGISALELDAQP